MKKIRVPCSRRRIVKRLTPVAAAVITALHGAPALAEVAAATGADMEGEGLQEVVVTATRRQASAQDIPISITALSGVQLERAGIEDMSDLAHSVAGVSYTDKGPFGGVNGANLIIRGLNSETTAGLPAAA